MIICDICHETGKVRYKGVEVEGKWLTVCEECRYGKKIKRSAKSDNEKFNELQTPFWKILGLKPKNKEIQLDRYLKSKGMTYGDWRRAREYGQATHQSAYREFERHINKYGTGNAPDPSFGKKG